jgi:hypothetical protein
MSQESDRRIHDALTELYLYALVLDAEWKRLGDDAPGDLYEEVDALRATAAALREQAENVLRPARSERPVPQPGCGSRPGA